MTTENERQQDTKIREFLPELVAAMLPETDADSLTRLIPVIEIGREDGLRVTIRSPSPEVVTGKGYERLKRLKQGLQRITGVDDLEVSVVRPVNPDEAAAGADWLLNCSFCGKTQKKVSKLIAGPGVYICDECVGLCNQILVEEGNAPAPASKVDTKVSLRPAAGLPDDEVLKELTHAAGIIAPIESHVQGIVSTLRERGVSWAQIGGALGMTRQGAWARFSQEE